MFGTMGVEVGVLVGNAVGVGVKVGGIVGVGVELGERVGVERNVAVVPGIGLVFCGVVFGCERTIAATIRMMITATPARMIL